MKRKLALLLGLVAAVALVRLLRRRASRVEAADPRAQALRRKLADRRRGGHEAETAAASPRAPTAAEDAAPRLGLEAEAGEAAGAPELPVEEARRRVHEEARAALDEMRRSGDGP